MYVFAELYLNINKNSECWIFIIFGSGQRICSQVPREESWPKRFFLPNNCTPDKFIHVPKGILMEICIKYIHVEILMTMCQISRTAKTSLKVSGFRHRISPPDFYFFFAEWPRLKILQRTAIRGDAVSRHHGPPWNPCQTSRQYGTEGFKQGP